MKDQIVTSDRIETNLLDESFRFGFRLGSIACVLVGIWAFGCLVSAFMQFSPSEILHGYITAITGM